MVPAERVNLESSEDDDDYDDSSGYDSSSGESDDAVDQTEPVHTQEAVIASSTKAAPSLAASNASKSVALDLSVAQAMVLEAEPAEDLVVISDAVGCDSWIGQALRSSQFLAIVRTPAAPSNSLIVEASLAEKFGLPIEVRQRPWVALRVRRRLSDPRVPLAVLNALCEQLVEAGVEPRTLVPVDSRSYILIARDRVQAATAVLVQLGHLVSPMARLCPLEEAPVTDPEQLRPHVGVWRLVRRETGSSGTGSVEDYSFAAADPVGNAPIRIQAENGLFVEFRVSAQGGPSSAAACFGVLALNARDAAKGVRHITISFQPPSGATPPSHRMVFDGTGDRITMREEIPCAVITSSGIPSERIVEQWAKLVGGDQKVTALELADRAPKAGSGGKKCCRGAWLFSGKYFAYIAGPQLGEGVVGTTCCRSLAHLEVLHGKEAVHTELRRDYEAVIGKVERPGLLTIIRDAWDASRAGTVFYDAKAAGANKSLGSIEVQLEDGFVQRKLPTGELQRWRIHDWAFDPFSPPPPPRSALPASSKVSDSDASDDEEEEEGDDDGSSSDAEGTARPAAASSDSSDDKDAKAKRKKRKKSAKAAAKSSASVRPAKKNKKDKKLKGKEKTKKGKEDKGKKQKQKNRSSSRKGRGDKKTGSRHRSKSGTDDEKTKKTKGKNKHEKEKPKRKDKTKQRTRHDSRGKKRKRSRSRSRSRKRKASSKRRSVSSSRGRKEKKRKSSSRSHSRHGSRDRQKHKRRSASKSRQRSKSRSRKRSASRKRKQRSSSSSSSRTRKKLKPKRSSKSGSRKRSVGKDTPAARAAAAAKELEKSLVAKAQRETLDTVVHKKLTAKDAEKVKLAAKAQAEAVDAEVQKRMTAKEAEQAYLTKVQATSDVSADAPPKEQAAPGDKVETKCAPEGKATKESEDPAEEQHIPEKSEAPKGDSNQEVQKTADVVIIEDVTIKAEERPAQGAEDEGTKMCLEGLEVQPKKSMEHSSENTPAMKEVEQVVEKVTESKVATKDEDEGMEKCKGGVEVHPKELVENRLASTSPVKEAQEITPTAEESISASKAEDEGIEKCKGDVEVQPKELVENSSESTPPTKEADHRVEIADESIVATKDEETEVAKVEESAPTIESMELTKDDEQEKVLPGSPPKEESEEEHDGSTVAEVKDDPDYDPFAEVPESNDAPSAAEVNLSVDAKQEGVTITSAGSGDTTKDNTQQKDSTILQDQTTSQISSESAITTPPATLEPSAVAKETSSTVSTVACSNTAESGNSSSNSVTLTSLDQKPLQKETTPPVSSSAPTSSGLASATSGTCPPSKESGVALNNVALPTVQSHQASPVPAPSPPSAPPSVAASPSSVAASFGANIPDLISAFAVQNQLTAAAEKTLRELPADIGIQVMRKGPLEGADKSTALLQRVQMVVVDVSKTQVHPAGSQPILPVQVQQATVYGQIAIPGVPPPVPLHQQITSKTQMQPPGPQPVMPMQVAASGVQQASMHGQIAIQGGPPLAHLQEQVQTLGQLVTPAHQIMTQQQSVIMPQVVATQQQQAGLLQQHITSGHPQVSQQSQLQQPSGVGAGDHLIQLMQFCQQNGVGADVQQVLRGAPVDLQLKVMAEGPLVGGSSPSEVLIARVRRMMGQTQV